jgi:hypothetical protein
MDPQAASENLQLIRTLMERAVLYRRALAPVMMLNGIVAIAATVTGVVAHLEMLHGFVRLWMAAGVVGILGTLLVARRQSLRAGEVFCAPPARRVIAAMFPALLLGGCVGLSLLRLEDREIIPHLWLPVLWIALYGCALHAAGWFTTRGLRWFGLLNLLPACAVLPFLLPAPNVAPWQVPHLIMGAWFGLLHLAFGAWLYATEGRGSAT